MMSVLVVIPTSVRFRVIISKIVHVFENDPDLKCKTASVWETVWGRPRPLVVIYSREVGLEVKYFTIDRCRDGILQQQNTSALAAMMPKTNTHIFLIRIWIKAKYQVCVCVCLTCHTPLPFTQTVPPLIDLVIIHNVMNILIHVHTHLIVRDTQTHIYLFA